MGSSQWLSTVAQYQLCICGLYLCAANMQSLSTSAVHVRTSVCDDCKIRLCFNYKPTKTVNG